MSLSLTENGHGEFGEGVSVGNDGAAQRQAVGIVVERDRYDPDHDVGIDKVALENPVDKLTEALSSRKGVSLELQLKTKDGRFEIIELDRPTSKLWLKSWSLRERIDFANASIKRRRATVALEALQRLSESGLLPTKANLRPDEEAYLREFGFIEDDATEPLPEGGYKPVGTRLREGSQRVRTLEDFPDFFGGPSGPAVGGYVTGGSFEYLPISGPAMQTQTISDVQFALSRAWWHWVHHPAAKRGCSLVRNFVLGRGVRIKCRDKNTQEFVDNWVDTEQFQERLRSIVTSLVRDGDLFIHKLRPGDGSLHVRELPPMTMWDVVCDAEDVETVFYYIQRLWTITHPLGGPKASENRWIERNYPANDVIHIKINAAPGELRGRGELHAILVDLKRLADLKNATVAKEQAAAAYQWHTAVTGGPADVAAIQRAIQSNPNPPPGSQFVTNDVVKITAVASGLRANQAGSGSVYEMVLNEIAIGFGFSLDYFGAGSHSNRASALVKNEPSTKTIEDWQEIVGGQIIIPILREAIAEAKRKGDSRLAKASDEDFSVMFPALARADSSTRVTMICRGESMNYISKRTAAEMWAAESDVENYDYDDEHKAIIAELKDETGDVISHDFEQVKKGLPEPSDVAFGPGEVPDPAFAGGAPAAPPSEIPTDPANPLSGVGAAKIKRDMATGDRRSGRGMTEARRRQQQQAAVRILEDAGALVILP